MSEQVYVGIGASYLWPWNCLQTAAVFIGPYLRTYPALEKSYSSAIMLGSTCVNLVVSSWLAMHPRSFGARIKFGQRLIAIGFVSMSILTFLNIDPVPYFFCIVLLVFFISVGTTNVQNGVTAITQRLPGGGEARAVLIGQALSGIVPPIFGLLLGLTGSDLDSVSAAVKRTIKSLANSLQSLGLNFVSSLDIENPPLEIPDETNTATLLFLSSSLLSLWVCWRFRGPEVEEHIKLSEEESEQTHPSHTLWELFHALKSPGIAIFLSFVASLTYSVFANLVTSKTIPSRFFSPLTHFLWNAGDLSGRVFCESDKFLIHKPRKLVLYGYCRLLFIPTLLFLSWLGNPSDIIYLGIQLAYGFTNGHLFSSAISYAPSCVSVEQRPSAGGIIGMIISFGLVSGAILSFLVVPFVSAI